MSKEEADIITEMQNKIRAD
jgi:hypothetical protein